MDLGSFILSISILSSVSIAFPTFSRFCAMCSNATSVDKCIDRVVCASSYYCYLDKIIGPDLSVRFNAGCKTKPECDLNSGGKRYTTELGRSRKQTTLCALCCNEHTEVNTTLPCNYYLCKTVAPERPVCKVCAGVDDPATCTVSQQCQSHEACVQTAIVDGSSIKYNLGCESKAVCDILLKDLNQNHLIQLGKRYHGHVPICSACCVGDNCNSGQCKDLRSKQPCFDSSRCG